MTAPRQVSAECQSVATRAGVDAPIVFFLKIFLDTDSRSRYNCRLNVGATVGRFKNFQNRVWQPFVHTGIVQRTECACQYKIVQKIRNES